MDPNGTPISAITAAAIEAPAYTMRDVTTKEKTARALGEAAGINIRMRNRPKRRLGNGAMPSSSTSKVESSSIFGGRGGADTLEGKSKRSRAAVSVANLTPAAKSLLEKSVGSKVGLVGGLSNSSANATPRDGSSFGCSLRGSYTSEKHKTKSGRKRKKGSMAKGATSSRRQAR